MKKAFTFILLCFMIKANAQQTTTCACCTEKHKQFNFWLGHWDVYDTTGKKVGENKIEVIEGGCGLRENWISNTQTGTSNNYYNPVDSSWNQLWLDNTGTILKLKGYYLTNRMTLTSDPIRGTKIPFYYNQIVWDKNSDGTITQTWDVRDNTGKLLQRVFKGIYKLKPKTIKQEKGIKNNSTK